MMTYSTLLAGHKQSKDTYASFYRHRQALQFLRIAVLLVLLATVWEGCHCPRHAAKIVVSVIMLVDGVVDVDVGRYTSSIVL
jgi:hypothetical protein